MPKSIVSDRGSNWTSPFGRAFCKAAGIQQRLSTAYYHPQTDRGPESQPGRYRLTSEHTLAIPKQTGAQLALNNRKSSAIGMSPFFMGHGYHIEPFQLVDSEQPAKICSEREVARTVLQKVRDTTNFIQAALAATQQRYEEATNKRRKPSERFEVGV